MEVSDSSNLNPWASVFLSLMAFVMMYSTRTNAVIALLATAVMIPLGQQIVVAGLHFRFSRILILVGLLRVFLRGEAYGFRFTRIDRFFVSWALIVLACGILRGPKAETFGMAYDALGTFFLFRIWIPCASDCIIHLRVLATLSVIVAGSMAFELISHRNLFAVFGGVPELTVVREGRFRCQGPFRHPILAGTFAATLFPLMVGLWQQGGGSRRRACFGIVSSAFCSYAAASSGALLTVVGACAGLAVWSMRRKMHLVRIWSVLIILQLAIIMEAPVWYLIAKIGRVIGGTGWHRSYLIDQAVERLGEWWLIGTSYTAHWAADPTTILPMDPNNMDITNHYIAQGINGGLLGLVLFVAILVGCFRTVGLSIRNDLDQTMHPKLRWALGVGLFANCVAFLSVSYFDQIVIYWYWLLAVVSTLSYEVARKTEPKPVAVGAEFAYR